MHEFTEGEIRAYYSTRVPQLKQTRSKHWRCPCPVHQGTRDSFSVDSGTGLCFCFSQCGKGWDVIGLEQELSGADFRTAKQAVWSIIGRPELTTEELDVVATYDYTDESGNMLYQVLRLTPDGDGKKRFRQRRPNPAGGWIWDLKGITPVPYNLPLVAQARFVAVVEGEKDAITLTRSGIVATCNNGGAEHFTPSLAKWFSGKSVGVFADNDEKGESHAMKVAAALKDHAKSLRIVELPNLPPKGDVTDFIQRGGTKEQILEACKRAVEWTPEFQFGVNVPHENDKYISTIVQSVEEDGNVERFWDLARNEGLETPWPGLTRSLRGLRKGEVYVIGANQGAGKTSMGLQFVLHSMLKEVATLLFSMEMGHKDVLQRLIAIRAAVDLMEFRDQQISRGPMLAELKSRLFHATHELADRELLVSNKTSVTPKFLLDETKRLVKRNKIGLVVIDHMQLMGAEKTARSEYEKFTSISRATKQVAMELQLPVILLSQTSRTNSRDHRTELDCSDLRGSGALEEDAAAVMLVYPDADDRKAAMEEGNRWLKGPVLTWLKLGKNRFGEQTAMKLAHLKGITKFEPMV